MANRNFPNGGRKYQSHAKPVTIDAKFVVSAADAGGLGIIQLKSAGMVKNVFMHSSNTAAATAAGNPNPASGIIAVQFNDNYRRFLSADAHFTGPQIGSFPSITSSTSTTIHVLNTIAILGTATLAQWQAVGLPVGITPAVGVTFLATSTAVIGGSAQVSLALATGAGIDHIETVGNPSLILSPSASSTAGIGGYMYFRCYNATTLTAPADGTIIRLTFNFDDSSVLPGDGG